jgi:hypothetical protein
MLTEPQDAVTQPIQKDLVLGHLLYLVWGPRGLLPDALAVWQLNYKIFRYIASFS